MKLPARLPKWFGQVIAFAILIVCGLWFFNGYIARVSVPHHAKLADCTNGIVTFHFTVPKGHGFRFDLNTGKITPTPNGDNSSSYKFLGHIHISNGDSLVADFPIGSDRAWLVGSDFVLTGAGSQNTNTPPLSQYIQAQMDYDVQITFDPPPPLSSSIWLYWLQSKKDSGD